MPVDTRRQDTLVQDMNAIENANVCVLGAGAVGSVLAQILARMGFGTQGTITLVDGDDVEDHNLSRQLYNASHIGWNKAMATEEQVQAIDNNINTQCIPRYVFVDEGFDVNDYDIIVSAIDSLFIEATFYEACCAESVAFTSPRMTGYTVEHFAHWSWSDEHVDASNDVYFADSADKQYGDGASCSGDVEEDVVPAISTTTNVISAIAAQGVLAWTQDWPFDPHVRFDLREQFEAPVELVA